MQTGLQQGTVNILLFAVLKCLVELTEGPYYFNYMYMMPSEVCGWTLT